MSLLNLNKTTTTTTNDSVEGVPVDSYLDDKTSYKKNSKHKSKSLKSSTGESTSKANSSNNMLKSEIQILNQANKELTEQISANESNLEECGNKDKKKYFAISAENVGVYRLEENDKQVVYFILQNEYGVPILDKDYNVVPLIAIKNKLGNYLPKKTKKTYKKKYTLHRTHYTVKKIEYMKYTPSIKNKQNKNTIKHHNYYIQADKYCELLINYNEYKQKLTRISTIPKYYGKYEYKQKNFSMVNRNKPSIFKSLMEYKKNLIIKLGLNVVLALVNPPLFMNNLLKKNMNNLADSYIKSTTYITTTNYKKTTNIIYSPKVTNLEFLTYRIAEKFRYYMNLKIRPFGFKRIAGFKIWAKDYTKLCIMSNKFIELINEHIVKKMNAKIGEGKYNYDEIEKIDYEYKNLFTHLFLKNKTNKSWESELESSPFHGSVKLEYNEDTYSEDYPWDQ